MAQWSIELRKINNLFDFDYPFYNMDLKPLFEDLFIRHYAFHEIGFKTIGEFKFRLQTYLMENYDTFKQLYEIELRCKQLDFMSNKDYKETLKRDINEKQLNKIISKSLNDSLSSSEDLSEIFMNNLNTMKESSQDDGVAILDIKEGSLTNVTENEVNSSEQNKSKNSSNFKSNNTTDTDNNNDRIFSESITTIGKGNIGITSTAELKQGWQNSITNLNLKIILGARNLFMLRY